MSNATDAMNTLTDEQVKELGDTLESVESPARKQLQEAIANGEEVIANMSEVVNIYQNPDGTNLPVNANDNDGFNILDKSFEEILEDDSFSIDDIDPDTVDITKESVSNVIEPIFEDYKGISDEDVAVLVTLARRYMKNEKFSYYNSMPASIKIAIDSILGMKAPEMGSFNREGRNFIASSLLKEISNSAILNATIIDFQKTIEKTAAEATEEIRGDEYWFKVRDFFLTTAADKIQTHRNNGENEIADRYEAARNAFIESYTFEDLKKTYESGKLKVKKIEIEKFERTCHEFNFSYSKSQNAIRDITQVLPILQAQLDDDLTLDSIKRFVVIFIKYTRFKHMDPNNFFNHTYMYFFIYNILTISNYDRSNEDDTRFHFNYIKTLNNFVHEIQNNNK